MEIPQKDCLVCKKTFYNSRLNRQGQRIRKWTKVMWEKSKFCSHTCRHKYMAGRPTNVPLGNKNPLWVGDRIKYSGLHYWVREQLGTHPVKCAHCSKPGKKTGRMWSIHYANISGKYKRKKDDWTPLCVTCHRAFDKMKR